jgi:hypothetical protein
VSGGAARRIPPLASIPGWVEGEIDLEPYLTFERVFAPLRDPTYFARVRVSDDLGTISWPNDADWDTLVLYSLVTQRSIETLLAESGGSS